MRAEARVLELGGACADRRLRMPNQLWSLARPRARGPDVTADKAGRGPAQSSRPLVPAAEPSRRCRARNQVASLRHEAVCYAGQRTLLAAAGCGETDAFGGCDFCNTGGPGSGSGQGAGRTAAVRRARGGWSSELEATAGLGAGSCRLKPVRPTRGRRAATRPTRSGSAAISADPAAIRRDVGGRDQRHAAWQDVPRSAASSWFSAGLELGDLEIQGLLEQQPRMRHQDSRS